jgi:quinoprotein glucose dehydrogenase
LKRIAYVAALAAAAGCLAWQIESVPHEAATLAVSQSARARLLAADSTLAPSGARVYAANCSVCHGDKRQGNPPAIPSLIGIGKRMTAKQIADHIQNHKNRMPSQPEIKGEELSALLGFLITADTNGVRLTPAKTTRPAWMSPRRIPD